MTYAFTQDVPFTANVYERFRTALSGEAPPGLVVHMAIEIENGVRFIQVWESEADYANFLRERVSPIVSDGFFESTGYEPPEQEPPKSPLKLLDVWKAGDQE